MKKVVRRLIGCGDEDEDEGARRKRESGGDEEEGEGYEWEDDVCPLLRKPATKDEEEVYYDDDLYPSRYILEHASEFFEGAENFVFERDPSDPPPTFSSCVPHTS